MKKLIRTEQLRLGMFVNSFEGSWLKHPFWRTSFLLENQKDLDIILSCGIKGVWIDLSRGCGPAPDSVPSAIQSVPRCDSLNSTPTPTKPSSPVRLTGTTMSQELVRAKRILLQSRDAVTSLFNDARLGKAVDDKVASQIVEEVSSSVIRNPGALVSIVRLKNQDDYTYMHSVAVCALMVALARQLGFDARQCRDAAIGGLMHDIGKALMPLDILNKPSSLSEDEYTVIKRHPEAGWKLLKDGGGVTATALDIALHHHEKVDGTGYPHRLKSTEITLMSRMGAVCDVYDAITSDRPYKTGWDPGIAIRRMNSWTGHFDPMVLKAFIRGIGIYPVGSLVRLASGRLAVVAEQNDNSLLTPKVTVFFSVKTSQPISQQIIDLSAQQNNDKIISIESTDNWHFKNLDRILNETWHQH